MDIPVDEPLSIENLISPRSNDTIIALGIEGSANKVMTAASHRKHLWFNCIVSKVVSALDSSYRELAGNIYRTQENHAAAGISCS